MNATANVSATATTNGVGPSGKTAKAAKNGIRSMTGFASVVADMPTGRLGLELKSVNHRYLEFQTRMPEELRAHEFAMRELVAAQLSRGKVDCRVTFTAVATRDALSVDEAALDALSKLQAQIQAKLDARGLSVWEVMHAPGVMADSALNGEAAKDALLALTSTALDELSATRSREGEKLAAMIVERLDAIDALAQKVVPLVPALVQAYESKLRQKLAEMSPGLESDERIKQEVVLFASRLDVAEELNRLSAHVGEVKRVLKSGGAVGKRLDFLMQELNREANTLGSKAGSTEMTNISVELKVLIEQMREQIQNIE